MAINVSECPSSSQTTYTLKFKQTVKTFGQADQTNTGSGNLPNQTWTASGAGASTSNTGNMSWEKNMSESSRGSSQNVSFTWRGESHSASLDFSQCPRTVNTGRTKETIYTSDVSITISPWDFGCGSHTATARQTVTQRKYTEYYDTCGELWSEKNKDESYSSSTFNAGSRTHNACNSLGTTIREDIYASGTYYDKNGNRIDLSSTYDWARWYCDDCNACGNCPPEPEPDTGG